MHHHIRKLSAITVATSMALASGPSRALIENDGVYPPSGGWGNSSGSVSGGGYTGSYSSLPEITVIGTRPDTLSNVYVINVPYTQNLPNADRDPGSPVDPAKQKACIDACDQKQKIAQDLCAVAAAKAAASSTVTAIGIGFAAAGGLSMVGGIKLGAPGGFAAYYVANQMAKDHAANLSMACLARAAQDHANCVTGVCKFSA